jgi:hypothetical protein
MMDNTLIIFAADHGEEFFDHGGFEHGMGQFDELVREPLIVRGPDFTPGAIIDTSTGNTDIFPTVLRYLGLPLPADLAGVPLQDVVAGKVASDRLIFGEGNTRGPLKKYAVKWPYKCILDFVSGNASLYDLSADPKEKTDIAGQFPDLSRDLSRSIALAMRPDKTAIYLWVTRSIQEAQKRFTGTVRVEGGIENVEAFLLEKGDTYQVNGDTVTFDITSASTVLGPNKHLTITPAKGANLIYSSVRVDGKIAPDRYFPHGNFTQEPTGEATVSLDDYPIGPDLPITMEESPSMFFLWGVRGQDREANGVELDEQTKAQLKSLGYVD